MQRRSLDTWTTHILGDDDDGGGVWWEEGDGEEREGAQKNPNTLVNVMVLENTTIETWFSCFVWMIAGRREGGGGMFQWLLT